VLVPLQKINEKEKNKKKEFKAQIKQECRRRGVQTQVSKN
jgi:hypothetical protein